MYRSTNSGQKTLRSEVPWDRNMDSPCLFSAVTPMSPPPSLSSCVLISPNIVSFTFHSQCRVWSSKAGTAYLECRPHCFNLIWWHGQQSLKTLAQCRKSSLHLNETNSSRQKFVIQLQGTC